MTSHRQIMVNLGDAARQSSTVLNAALTAFGKGLDIVVGAYPAGIPDVADAPFLWITATGENNAVATDEIFTVHAVVGGCVLSEDGERVILNRIHERTDAANGLAVNGGNATVEALRDTIITALLAANCGAPIMRVRRFENDLSHFPLEWAEFEVDFIDPGTINNEE